MKLLDKAAVSIDKALNKAVELRQPVKDLADGLKAVAEQTEKLALNLAVIAHNQAVHHQMILQLVRNHNVIMTRLHEGAMDMKMPDIDQPKPEDKLAAAKKKAESKPN